MIAETGIAMRNFSFGIALCVLLVISLAFCGMVSRSAEANDETVRVADEKNAASAEPAIPGPEKRADAPVSLVADQLSFNEENQSYEAIGDVVLRQGDLELRANELLWQASTQDAAARGEVLLNDADVAFSGDSMQYNMSTGQGLARGGRVLVHSGNFHLAGDEIEKHGQANYFVKDGSFTTCDGEIPDWKFSAREVNVDLGGYARAKGVFFHIRDVPVLYAPLMYFPVKTERESGLLAPWFGYSKNKGTRASMAWYQVIDRNMDATLYLDYLSKVGLGTGLEYRYALANQNNGKALYYHVAGIDEMPNTYYLAWKHRGNLPGGWTLTSDVEYTDKQEFFDEFGETAEEYNRDQTVSTVIFQRNWQKLNLVGMGRYLKDLEGDNDESLQRLPELGLGQSRYRLGETPLYLGLESYATSFQRDEGLDGERLYLRPFVSASFRPGAWLELTPEVSLHERLYDTDADDDHQFVPEYSLTLATRLVRTFAPNRWGMENLLHSIEPKVSYTYVPDKDQDDLPLFDLFDRQIQRNDVSYALVNRLTTSSTSEDGTTLYRDFLNLRLSQNYRFDDEDELFDDDRPFSDVRLELDFWPTRNVALDVDSLIPVYGNSGLRTMRIAASARDDIGNAVKVNYTYKDETFANAATDYIKFQLDTSLFKPVYVRFEERYDFRDSRELEKIVGLEYRSKCWSILMTYRDRYREDDSKDHEVMFSFVLAGLGMNKGFGNGFGSVD